MSELKKFEHILVEMPSAIDKYGNYAVISIWCVFIDKKRDGRLTFHT